MLVSSIFSQGGGCDYGHHGGGEYHERRWYGGGHEYHESSYHYRDYDRGRRRGRSLIDIDIDL